MKMSSEHEKESLDEPTPEIDDGHCLTEEERTPFNLRRFLKEEFWPELKYLVSEIIAHNRLKSRKKKGMRIFFLLITVWVFYDLLFGGYISSWLESFILWMTAHSIEAVFIEAVFAFVAIFILSTCKYLQENVTRRFEFSPFLSHLSCFTVYYSALDPPHHPDIWSWLRVCTSYWDYNRNICCNTLLFLGILYWCGHCFFERQVHDARFSPKVLYALPTYSSSRPSSQAERFSYHGVIKVLPVDSFQRIELLLWNYGCASSHFCIFLSRNLTVSNVYSHCRGHGRDSGVFSQRVAWMDYFDLFRIHIWIDRLGIHLEACETGITKGW